VDRLGGDALKFGKQVLTQIFIFIIICNWKNEEEGEEMRGGRSGRESEGERLIDKKW